MWISSCCWILLINHNRILLINSYSTESSPRWVAHIADLSCFVPKARALGLKMFVQDIAQVRISTLSYRIVLLLLIHPQLWNSLIAQLFIKRKHKRWMCYCNLDCKREAGFFAKYQICVIYLPCLPSASCLLDFMTSVVITPSMRRSHLSWLFSVLCYIKTFWNLHPSLGIC